MQRELSSNQSNPYHALAVFAAFTALAWLLLLPYSAHPATATIDRGDSVLNAWIIGWVNHALTTDPANLFNANIFHPYPNTLAFSENLLPTALTMLPVSLLSPNVLLAHNLAVILTFPLAALGMFLLARHLTFTLPAAWIAAAVFALAPMKFEELARVQVLSSQWIPFAVLFLDRFLEHRRWKDAALTGILTAVQILASYYLGFFLCILLTLWTLTRFAVRVSAPQPPAQSVSAGNGPPVRVSAPQPPVPGGAAARAPGLALAAVITLVLVIPMTLPYLDLHSELKFSRKLAEMCKYSADLTAYVNYATPFGRFGPYTRSSAFFPGIAVTGLTLAWLGLRRRTAPALPPSRSHVLPAALFAVITGFILSLGPELIIGGHGTDIPLPARLLWYILPGFRAFRILWRAEIIISFGLALIAAAGWTLVSRKISGPRLAALTTGVILLLSLERARWPVNYFTWPTPDRFPPYTAWLAKHDEVSAYVVDPFEQFHDLQEMLHGTAHWRPMVNGWSGFFPPDYNRTKWLMDRFPTPGSISLLREKQVSHVVIHTREVPVFHVRNMREECARFPELKLETDFGETLVYRLLPDE